MSRHRLRDDVPRHVAPRAQRRMRACYPVYDVAMSQGAHKRAGPGASNGAADRRGLETELREAGRLLAAGDAPAAAERLRGIVARGVLPPGREADARYLLARALGVCGDRAGMTDQWGLVLRLDAAAAAAAAAAHA